MKISSDLKGRPEDIAPRARQKGLVVRELDGEILIYDRERDQALGLNGTAAAVWRHCDGATTVPEMVDHLAQELGVTVDEHAIYRTLAQLSKDGLLEEQANTMSRRKMMARTGVAAAAVIPLITGLSVPSATAFALTTCTPQPGCISPGQTCVAGHTCCPNPGGRCGCCYLGCGAPGTCGICSSGCCQVDSNCNPSCSGHPGPTQVCSG